MSSAVVAPLAVPRSRAWLKQLGLVFVVLLMGVALSIAGHVNRYSPDSPNIFLNRDNLVGILATSMSYYAIMAAGLTVVIISGGIDISVGSIMGLSAILTAWAIQQPKLAAATASGWTVLPLAIGLPIAIGLTCGLINGLLVVGLRLHPFIVTLGTLGIFRGLVNTLPPNKTIPNGLAYSVPDVFKKGLIQREWFAVEAVPLLIMLVVVGVIAFYLRRCVAGVHTYAVGGNEEASRLSGLNVGRIKVTCYAISGTCAGIAAIVLLGHHGTASATSGEGYELTVVAAAVVGGASLSGGRGTAIGALLGTLVIALIENGISIMHWNEEYRRVIIGSAILAAATIDRVTESFGGRSR